MPTIECLKFTIRGTGMVRKKELQLITFTTECLLYILKVEFVFSTHSAMFIQPFESVNSLHRDVISVCVDLKVDIILRFHCSCCWAMVL